MSKVSLYEYEKAKKVKKVGEAVEMCLGGLLVTLIGGGVLFLLGALLWGLWTSGVGWGAVLIVLIIGALGTSFWASASTKDVLDNAQTYGVVDE